MKKKILAPTAIKESTHKKLTKEAESKMIPLAALVREILDKHVEGKK